MKQSHHALSYVEITVQDLGRARDFYGRAFGWRFNDYGPDYAGVQGPAGDGEVGGLSVGSPTGPGGVLALLFSEDVDASAAAVAAAGGALVDPPYEYPGGRRFVFTDPDGNRLGVYQPSDG